MIVSGGLLLAAIPGVRRQCAVLLAPRIARGKRREVLLALLIDMTVSLGAMGGFAFWWYASGGEPALARAMGETSSHSVQMDQALHPSNIVCSCSSREPSARSSKS